MKGSLKSRSAIREKCGVTESAKQTGNTNGKRGRRRLAAVGILLLLAGFVLSPFSKLILSLSVMSVYSGVHERQSIMEEKGIELSIPGGGATSEADWYPFVMTFNPSAESFCRFIGEANRELTILYNFPAFDLRRGKGCSRLYDPTSPYYNAFYGAYLVTDAADVSETGDTFLNDAADASGTERQKETAAGEAVSRCGFDAPARGTAADMVVTSGSAKSAPASVADAKTSSRARPPFGFRADGSLDLAKTGLVPQYDFEQLVLRDFGLRAQDMQFDWTVREVRTVDGFLGYDGWSCVDADLVVNGAFHRAHGFRQSYLQYGTPKYDAIAGGDFAPVTMCGRVYARYFSEWESSVFFYVMAPSWEVVASCDQQILQKSKLR